MGCTGILDSNAQVNAISDEDMAFLVMLSKVNGIVNDR
jgi:hypothetical protein